MATTSSTKVRFLGGAIARADLAGAIAYPEGLDGTDTEFTRLYMRHGAQWFQQEFNSDIASVCYFPDGEQRGWWLAGKRGDIHSITASGRQTESIDKAGTGPDKQGYVKKIRPIGGSLHACGYRRQVYRREGKAWQSIADPIAAKRTEVGFVFNDIDGSSASDVYAAGNRGEIYHFDGTRWQLLDSGTNVHLEGLSCHGGVCIAVGRDGVILRGDRAGFSSIGPGTPELNFWDIAVFRDTFYVAASAGVFEVGPAPAFDLRPSAFPKHVGYKLASSPERIISVGTHQLLAFDGQSVVELVCPDNQ